MFVGFIIHKGMDSHHVMFPIDSYPATLGVKPEKWDGGLTRNIYIIIMDYKMHKTVRI